MISTIKKIRVDPHKIAREITERYSQNKKPILIHFGKNESYEDDREILATSFFSQRRTIIRLLRENGFSANRFIFLVLEYGCYFCEICNLDGGTYIPFPKAEECETIPLREIL